MIAPGGRDAHWPLQVLRGTAKASTFLFVCRKQLACVKHRHRIYSTKQQQQQQQEARHGCWPVRVRVWAAAWWARQPGGLTEMCFRDGKGAQGAWLLHCWQCLLLLRWCSVHMLCISFLVQPAFCDSWVGGFRPSVTGYTRAGPAMYLLLELQGSTQLLQCYCCGCGGNTICLVVVQPL